jgi:hypothetical protein
MPKGQSLASIVKDYKDITLLESEARRRRRAVAKAVNDGRISTEDMADLIGITDSGVWQLAKRYND